MAVRITKDGRILCAAMHPETPGDTYIDDGLHYRLSVLNKVLVTECAERHGEHGQWWWRNNVPPGVVIDPFYLEPVTAGGEEVFKKLRRLAQMFLYLEWLDSCHAEEISQYSGKDLSGESLVLASDGLTCFAGSYRDALGMAMGHDEKLFQPNDRLETELAASPEGAA